MGIVKIILYIVTILILLYLVFVMIVVMYTTHAAITPINPNPQHGIKFRVEVKSAPRPIQVNNFFITHMADNCTYYDTAFSIEYDPHPQHPATIHTVANYKKIDNNTYELLVYTDAMLDRNDYGTGVCRWRIRDLDINLTIDTAQGKTFLAYKNFLMV